MGNKLYTKELLLLVAKDTSETFIKVYNIQTGDTTNIDLKKCDYYGYFSKLCCTIFTLALNRIKLSFA